MRHSSKLSLPSLEEAVAELRDQMVPPMYKIDFTNERIARDAAFYAGQLWAVEQLDKLIRKYGKEAGQ